MPSLIIDLTLILVTAGIVTIVFKKLKQPLVLGYIVAGFIVSPNLPITVSITDPANISIWANIGVMFLLFTLGLDFSFKKIFKMGMAPIIAALAIVASMMTIGFVVSDAFGWPHMSGLFVSCMIAMSSTTIIYKAFDDMGLQHQQFAGLVMSVLILEDILAIVLMVILSTIVKGEGGVGDSMLQNVMGIGFFLILWFVVGLFFIPIFLRKVRQLINDEVLLILALALCCLMAVTASEVGFSPAFGSFVMGSILAETVEGNKIKKLVEPVKNLFGAIFFVSVGMLVDMQVAIDQWRMILVLTLIIILGQCVFGTFSFMLAGQPLKTAMRCGFSMAQIGEFAFIIASMGLSLGVVETYMYAVIVTVSVITTFLTPYMMRGAVPVYNIIERHLSANSIKYINKISDIAPSNMEVSPGNWRPLLESMLVNTLIYTVLCIAIMALMTFEGYKLLDDFISDVAVSHTVCIVLTILLMSPFLRAIIMKKNKSEEFKALWTGNHSNRPTLILTIVLRVLLVMSFIIYTCSELSDMPASLLVVVAVVCVVVIVSSRVIKSGSIQLEKNFLRNLKSKDVVARAHGEKRPLFEDRLLDRNIHISTLNVPQDSFWGGRNLRDLKLGQRFGVSVSSILRGNHRINIPSGDDYIFPHDQINVIGTDAQLTELSEAMKEEVFPEPVDYWAQDMQLRRLVVKKGSKFDGQSLISSDLRNMYSCMLIGKEADSENLSKVATDYIFQPGDIFWAVGEKQDLDLLSKDM